MKKEIFFQKKLPFFSKNLPLVLISLRDWALVRVEGDDAIKYLQSQMTCNLYSLDRKKFTFSMHCNPIGKVISFLNIFFYKESIAYILRRNILKKQIFELNKYSIFSKIRIYEDKKIKLFGITGFQKNKIFKTFFSEFPKKNKAIANFKEMTVLCYNLPLLRYIIITSEKNIVSLIKDLKDEIYFLDSQQWKSLDMESGYPIIDRVSFNKFIPHEINAKVLNCLSFRKGCYIGQETIARTEYRNPSKRSLYTLVGNANFEPKVGENLEVKIDNEWYQIAKILAVCRMNNNKLLIQVVLNKSRISKKSEFRISENNESKFFLYRSY